jgi:hypothetical protein
MVGIIRRIVRAGGYRIAKRAVRSVPVVGAVVVIGLAGYEIKKKGIVKGIFNATLDAIPLIGLAKNTVELFTGDWFPDKERGERRERVKRGEESERRL